ncbi:MAG: hypothetical protein MUC72_04785 [Acidobacteria bacterium]|jgi:hypothetical protein|nr:hypothetical protein [Acidobacteriota bacterium]
MRYILLVILVALALVLVIATAKGRPAGSAAAAPARLDAAKAATLEPILLQVQAALDAYAEENGGLPAALEALLPRFLPRADALVDPWGTGLRLERDDLGDAVLVCAGPDRTFATADDTRRSI